jgi:hypothetical protein
MKSVRDQSAEKNARDARLRLCSGRFGFIEPGSSCLGVAFLAAHFSAPSFLRQTPMAI